MCHMHNSQYGLPKGTHGRRALFGRALTRVSSFCARFWHPKWRTGNVRVCELRVVWIGSIHTLWLGWCRAVGSSNNNQSHPQSPFEASLVGSINQIELQDNAQRIVIKVFTIIEFLVINYRTLKYKQLIDSESSQKDYCSVHIGVSWPSG